MSSRRLYDRLAHTFGRQLWELDHHEANGHTWAAQASLTIIVLAQEVASDLKVDNARFDTHRFMEAVYDDRRKRHELAAQREEAGQ
jgi:hypothetical protein